MNAALGNIFRCDTAGFNFGQNGPVTRDGLIEMVQWADVAIPRRLLTLDMSDMHVMFVPSTLGMDTLCSWLTRPHVTFEKCSAGCLVQFQECPIWCGAN